MSVSRTRGPANPRTGEQGPQKIGGSLQVLSQGQFSRNPNWMMRLEFSTTLVVR